MPGRSFTRMSPTSRTRTEWTIWSGSAAEVERRVLAQAVRWHLEDRVLVEEIRTVVFECSLLRTAHAVSI